LFALNGIAAGPLTQRAGCAGESGATARRGQEGFFGKMTLDRQCISTFVVM
jgi:hypothetical protein